MPKRKTKRKCPVCRSTRTEDNEDYFTCKNCNYVNYKKKKNSGQ